ncbi:MAG: hypothetical protein GY823_03920 [Flavobacteriaceae bacterium]|nr:hypothetical protein [Flavobacteriaceae bacterium]
MTKTDDFTPISFSGLLPEYFYQPTSSNEVSPRLLIGANNKVWKLEYDASDNNLKFYYSSDNQSTWTLKMELET